MRMHAILLFAFHFVSFWRTLCVCSSSFSHACYLLNEKKHEETAVWQAWWEVSGNDLTQLGAHIVSTQTGWHTYFFFLHLYCRFRPFRINAAVIHFVWRIFWVSFFYLHSSFWSLWWQWSIQSGSSSSFKKYLFECGKKHVSHLRI